MKRFLYLILILTATLPLNAFADGSVGPFVVPDIDDMNFYSDKVAPPRPVVLLITEKGKFPINGGLPHEIQSLDLQEKSCLLKQMQEFKKAKLGYKYHLKIIINAKQKPSLEADVLSLAVHMGSKRTCAAVPAKTLLKKLDQAVAKSHREQELDSNIRKAFKANENCPTCR